MSGWGDVFREHWNAVLGLRRVLFWLLLFSPCTHQTSGTTQSPATYRSILMIWLLWHVLHGGQEKEYRDLVESFYGWTKKNRLLLNTTKTKELVVDFRRSKTPYQLVCTDGGEIETVQTYKYLGVVLDNKLEWSANIEAVYRRGQSHLFFLRLLRSFNICSDMICMFSHTIIESALFYDVVCWGSCTTDTNCRRLDKLLKEASSVIGGELDSLRTVVEQRMRRKFY